ncbi:MAG: hypothetical protein ACK57K_04415 [Chryseotalea sp.]|jgi:hypothetical protein
MRSYVVFTLLISLLNLKSSSNSKPENPLESQVEIFCINLYSECCGTDIEISKLVISLEKKYNKSFIKTVKYWGKEGEQLFIYIGKVGAASEFQLFYEEASKIAANRKLVDTKEILTINNVTRVLIVQFVSIRLNKVNEDAWYQFLQRCKHEFAQELTIEENTQPDQKNIISVKVQFQHHKWQWFVDQTKEILTNTKP